MKRYSKRDWIVTGMKALAEKGEAAIRIESLCKQLKVSKGSFYHHFQNIDDYVSELFSFWEEENTTSIIQETEAILSIEQKTKKLNTLVLEKDHQVEVMIRSWAVRDNRIKGYVDKVDELRITYLQQLYIASGLAEQKALDLARIEYGIFVGMQYLYMNLPPEDIQRLSSQFQQLIKTNIL